MIRFVSIALSACLLASPTAFGHAAAAKIPSPRPLADGAASPAIRTLSDLAVPTLAAVDGSTLTLTPASGGLIREIVTPAGTTRRLVLTPINAHMGTVTEEGMTLAGLFLLAGNGLAITYADGRSENLVLNDKGEVSISETSDGAAHCSHWYPAGHRFSVEERRAALAAYARQLGLQYASIKSSAPEKGCAAPKLQPVNFAPAGTAAPELPRSAKKAILDAITSRMLSAFKTPARSSALAPYAEGTSQLFDKFYARFLAPHEGGYVENDGNAAPANFGINQGANPDVDVASLTQGQAKQILYERYWLASGADQMPPDLAAVHGDTAINLGLGAASDLLAQSGGDAGTYLDLREQRYRAIAAPDSDKAGYLPLWLARNDDLRSFVGGAPREDQDQTAFYQQPSRSPVWDMPLPDL